MSMSMSICDRGRGRGSRALGRRRAGQSSAHGFHTARYSAIPASWRGCESVSGRRSRSSFGTTSRCCARASSHLRFRVDASASTHAESLLERTSHSRPRRRRARVCVRGEASVSVRHRRARTSGLEHSGDVDGFDGVVAVRQREADVDDARPGECVAHPKSAIAGVRGRELVPRS